MERKCNVHGCKTQLNCRKWENSTRRVATTQRERMPQRSDRFSMVLRRSDFRGQRSSRGSKCDRVYSSKTGARGMKSGEGGGRGPMWVDGYEALCTVIRDCDWANRNAIFLRNVKHCERVSHLGWKTMNLNPPIDTPSLTDCSRRATLPLKLFCFHLSRFNFENFLKTSQKFSDITVSLFRDHRSWKEKFLRARARERERERERFPVTIHGCLRMKESCRGNGVKTEESSSR